MPRTCSLGMLFSFGLVLVACKRGARTCAKTCAVCSTHPTACFPAADFKIQLPSIIDRTFEQHALAETAYEHAFAQTAICIPQHPHVTNVENTFKLIDLVSYPKHVIERRQRLNGIFQATCAHGEHDPGPRKLQTRKHAREKDDVRTRSNRRNL